MRRKNTRCKFQLTPSLIQLCLKDKILNFEKINKILDSYLHAKKSEIDKKRKQNPVSLITSLIKTANAQDKKRGETSKNPLGSILLAVSQGGDKKPAGLLAQS